MSIKLTELEKLSKELSQIGDKLKGEVRMQIALDNKIGLDTVNRYMRGEGTTIIIARAILGSAKHYLKQVA